MNIENILGGWYLTDAYAVNDKGERLYNLYGKNPNGYIHYDQSGRMIVLITHDERSTLDGDRQAAPNDQKAEAFSSCISYSGPYELQGEAIKHHIDISTYQNWVGSTLTRYASLEGNNLLLRTPPQMQNGKLTLLVLEWSRNP